MRKSDKLTGLSLVFCKRYQMCRLSYFWSTCTITEVRLRHSFSQCELIMRQAVIKMFALIMFRVIRGGLQYTGEIKVGHAWRKELRRPTISQLPTTVKQAEKYERTVGHETQQDKPLSFSLCLIRPLSVRLKSCYTTTKECLIYRRQI